MSFKLYSGDTEIDMIPVPFYDPTEPTEDQNYVRIICKCAHSWRSKEPVMQSGYYKGKCPECKCAVGIAVRR